MHDMKVVIHLMWGNVFEGHFHTRPINVWTTFTIVSLSFDNCWPIKLAVLALLYWTGSSFLKTWIGQTKSRWDDCMLCWRLWLGKIEVVSVTSFHRNDNNLIASIKWKKTRSGKDYIVLYCHTTQCFLNYISILDMMINCLDRFYDPYLCTHPK